MTESQQKRWAKLFPPNYEPFHKTISLVLFYPLNVNHFYALTHMIFERSSHILQMSGGGGGGGEIIICFYGNGKNPMGLALFY